ncbi:MAG: zinc-binding dehydrogenase [Streptosporangiales bacterium]|nr:zinc-binding dehydrogenase [Streptosporangiales bacterium]
MRAWRVHELGEPQDVMRLDEVPVPEPGPGQIRIKIASAALNFPDILLCQGLYQERPPLPFTPGIEVAGTVDAAGQGAESRVGERVSATPVLPDGGLAEYVVVPAEAALPIPDEMSTQVGASMLITYQTGYVGLHRRAGLQKDETLLVHAGAGGVGSAAIQLGRAAGARVIATAGGAKKVETCRKLGAHTVIDYETEDFVEAVKEETGGRGADVIYDPVGGDVFDGSRRCVAFEGRLLVVGFAGGQIPQVPAGHVLVKNYSVVGLHWGLYRAKDPSVVTATHHALMDLFSEGKIDPLIDAVLPLDQAPSALGRLGARQTVGKTVLTP